MQINSPTLPSKRRCAIKPRSAPELSRWAPEGESPLHFACRTHRLYAAGGSTSPVALAGRGRVAAAAAARTAVRILKPA